MKGGSGAQGDAGEQEQKQRLHVELLGHFRVGVGTQVVEEAAWRLRKAGNLIKLLALAPRHRLHREEVMDKLWPDLPAGAAANNLHQVLHSARRTLEPDLPKDTPSSYLQIQGDEILLVAPGVVSVDVERFETAAAAATRAHAPDAVRAAVDLYTGALLPDDRYEEWAIRRREVLHELYLSLLFKVATLHEETGEVDQATEALHQVVASEPAHEEAHTRLMRLYAQAGQRQQALRQYARLRSALQQELGTEPAPESQQLYREILEGPPVPRAPLLKKRALSHAPRGHRPAAPTDLQARPPKLGPHKLPHQLTSFIGRDRELAELKQVLPQTRLLTLTGPGGCGKTRLALQVAAAVVDRFKEGVWFVELAPLADPGLLPQTVATALGVHERAGQPVLTTLIDQLEGQQHLLVLDNCEHLIAACAAFVHALLSASHHVQVLATSLEALNVPGEAIWRVPPLSLPDLKRLPPVDALERYGAIRLFVERARLAQFDFTLTARNAAQVAQICHRLDGMPLAIELAAARARTITIEHMADRLEESMHWLTTGSRTAPSRHQKMQAVVEWSYSLLNDPERLLFGHLAVFAGGFTLEAAEAVCAGDGLKTDDLLDILSHLIDKSLVMVDEGPDGSVRYRLLETVRQYSRDRLLESGEAPAVRKRHRDWYLALAERTEPMLLGPDEGCLDRLEIEHDNLRAALELSLRTGDVEAALRQAGALGRFWQVRGYWTEGRQWLEAGLEASGGAAPALRAKALNGAGALALYQGDYERARALSEASLVIQRELEDKRGLASSLRILGNVLYEQGNYRAAGELHEESLAYGREVDDKDLVASALVNLAIVAGHEGDYGRAVSLCEESLTLFREVRDKRGTAFALNMLGILSSDQGNHVTASSRYEESLVIQRELGDKRGIASSLNNLARRAREQSDYAAARALYEESLALRRELGDKLGIASSLANLGLVAWHQGDYPRATALLGESLLMRKAQGNKAGIAECLEGLARVTEDPERAARLFGAAAAMRAAVGAPLPPSDRPDYDRQLNVVRTELGREGFAAAWEQGLAMTLEQAIQNALAVATIPLNDPSTN